MIWNRIQLIGRLTRDPETKQVGQYELTQFSIAQNYKNKSGDVSHFFDCKAWNKAAQSASKLTKGELVIIEGKLEQESWQRKDGGHASKHVVNVNYIVQMHKSANAGIKEDPSEGIYLDPNGEIF